MANQFLVTLVFVQVASVLFSLAGAQIAQPLNLRGRALAVTPELPVTWQDDLLAAINSERANVGLAALCSNLKLNAAAKKHATDMAVNNYLGHDGSDASTITSRIVGEGFVYLAIAENVAAGQHSVASVMAAWMGSPGHRKNILGDYQYLGVSTEQNANSDFGTYWTLTLGSSDAEVCGCMLKN